MLQVCRLCATQARHFGTRGANVYFHCPTCDGVFLDSACLLGPADERARYEQHHNEATPEYEAFLSRLAVPLLRRLSPGNKGLDFGCGPVPVLSRILERAGMHMQHFDPFFFPQAAALSVAYDFVTCSETAEHFHFPSQEFDRLHGLIRPGGHLGVMTQRKDSWEGFWEWHYPRDPTHVFFYSEKTFRWVAAKYQWHAEFEPQGVVIFSA
ncbi:class I SAM-dependent methyltransferase [bacterium]|nr:class I SAM-dependent methyltransferase [bacterium]